MLHFHSVLYHWSMLCSSLSPSQWPYLRWEQTTPLRYERLCNFFFPSTKLPLPEHELDPLLALGKIRHQFTSVTQNRRSYSHMMYKHWWFWFALNAPCVYSFILQQIIPSTFIDPIIWINIMHGRTMPGGWLSALLSYSKLRSIGKEGERSGKEGVWKTHAVYSAARYCLPYSETQSCCLKP
jgi:hypothetical protein